MIEDFLHRLEESGTEVYEKETLEVKITVGDICAFVRDNWMYMKVNDCDYYLIWPKHTSEWTKSVRSGDVVEDLANDFPRNKSAVSLLYYEDFFLLRKRLFDT